MKTLFSILLSVPINIIAWVLKVIFCIFIFLSVGITSSGIGIMAICALILRGSGYETDTVADGGNELLDELVGYLKNIKTVRFWKAKLYEIKITVTC